MRHSTGIAVELIKGPVLKFRLREALNYHVAGEWLTVPEGFVSDGASVPRFFWRLLPPFGFYLRAAILHDWLYRTGWFDKAVADKILWIVARGDGTPLWQCWMIWAGLRIGGGRTWRRYMRLRAAGVKCVMDETGA